MILTGSRDAWPLSHECDTLVRCRIYQRGSR